MTIDELIIAMRALEDNCDTEMRHVMLDDLLLAYINDDVVTEVFNSFHKWYA